MFKYFIKFFNEKIAKSCTKKNCEIIMIKWNDRVCQLSHNYWKTNVIDENIYKHDKF